MAVIFSALLWLLFVFTSSAGTDTVTVSLPIAAGVKLEKVTVACPPHGRIDAIICVLVNVSTPVTFKVTGRLVSGEVPLLVITAFMPCAGTSPYGSSPYDTTVETAASLTTVEAKRVSGRKALAARVVGGDTLLCAPNNPLANPAALHHTWVVVPRVPVYWPQSNAIYRPPPVYVNGEPPVRFISNGPSAAGNAVVAL